MPVTPTIGTVYRNNHKHIEDAQLHPPLGYRLAQRDTFLSKSIHGENKWNDIMFQQPVIGFVTLGSSVAPNNGDRYIVLGSTVDGSYANATPNSIVEYLTLDNEGNAYNQWDYKGALTGMLTYVTGEDAFYFFDGASWQTIGTIIKPSDKDNATVTLNGNANNGLVNNYVDLFTPAVGKMFEAVLLKSTGLLPLDASISVVLHDGTPANDIEIMPSVSTAELDGLLFKYGCNGEVVNSGYSLKLLITDNTVTAGTVLVVANYLI